MSLNNNQMLCCLRVNQVNDELFSSKLKRHTINIMHWCILLTLVFYINNGDAASFYIYIYEMHDATFIYPTTMDMSSRSCLPFKFEDIGCNVIQKINDLSCLK